MMTWEKVTPRAKRQATTPEALHQLLFAAEPTLLLGVPRQRQHLIRRRMRAGIFSAVSDTLPLLRHFVGETQLRRWVDVWLDKAPPQTRFYWRLPVEFATWVMRDGSAHQEGKQKNDDTTCLSELAHFEAMQLEALNAPDPEPFSSYRFPQKNMDPRGSKLQRGSIEKPAQGKFDDFLQDLFRRDTLRVHPSARLGIYHYPVFRIDKKTKSLPAREVEPSFVLLYRANETCCWLLLPPQVAQLLAQAAQNSTSLRRALAFLCQLYGHVDEKFIRGELIDLQRRGVLLSSD